MKSGLRGASLTCGPEARGWAWAAVPTCARRHDQLTNIRIVHLTRIKALQNADSLLLCGSREGSVAICFNILISDFYFFLAMIFRNKVRSFLPNFCLSLQFQLLSFTYLPYLAPKKWILPVFFVLSLIIVNICCVPDAQGYSSRNILCKLKKNELPALFSFLLAARDPQDQYTYTLFTP